MRPGPGLKPSLRSACRHRRRSVSAVQPILPDIELIAANLRVGPHAQAPSARPAHALPVNTVPGPGLHRSILPKSGASDKQGRFITAQRLATWSAPCFRKGWCPGAGKFDEIKRLSEGGTIGSSHTVLMFSRGVSHHVPMLLIHICAARLKSKSRKTLADSNPAIGEQSTRRSHAYRRIRFTSSSLRFGRSFPLTAKTDRT
jgi:hypothetical protein